MRSTDIAIEIQKALMIRFCHFTSNRNCTCMSFNLRMIRKYEFKNIKARNLGNLEDLEVKKL